MSRKPKVAIDSPAVQKLIGAYRRRWGINLHLVQVDGTATWRKAGSGHTDQAIAAARRLALEEAQRWGEPTIGFEPAEHLVWAIPLMHNSCVLGGLVASVAERRVFASGMGAPRLDIRGACADLRRLAEEHNLTNAAFLAARRAEYRREQERAEAIHAFKLAPHYDLRALYLVEEPALIAAVRRGDRGAARAILNRLLVGLIHRAGPRLEAVKSYFMELLATLCRTVVEAGGAAEELWGDNFASITHLAAIQNEEQLSPWLHEMLERVLDAIHRHARQTGPVLAADALRFMNEHCCANVSRNEAARAMHLSPSHFSRIIRRHTGRTFSQLLNQMRVDRAADLLARSDKDLVLIALETGFQDQSYFTLVFRRLMGQTPRRYRLEHHAGS